MKCIKDECFDFMKIKQLHFWGIIIIILLVILSIVIFVLWKSKKKNELEESIDSINEMIVKE